MLSCVVPVYNNKEFLPLLVQRLSEMMWKLKLAHEIICIVDGSDDGSFSVLNYLQSLYPHLVVVEHEHRIGFYLSALEGIGLTKGSMVAFLDGSVIQSIASLQSYVFSLMTGRAEVAVGSRLHKASQISMSLLSKAALQYTTFFARSVVPLTDPMSNFFVAKREVFFDIDYAVDGVSVGFEVFTKGKYSTIEDNGYAAQLGNRDFQGFSMGEIGVALKQVKLARMWMQEKDQGKVENVFLG
ncbi:MAG: glycosyltransferase family 2 protein [bacterium]